MESQDKDNSLTASPQEVNGAPAPTPGPDSARLKRFHLVEDGATGNWLIMEPDPIQGEVLLESKDWGMVRDVCTLLNKYCPASDTLVALRSALEQMKHVRLNLRSMPESRTTWSLGRGLDEEISKADAALSQAQPPVGGGRG